MTDRVAIHVRITGRVQGVGYRYWTVEQAQARRLAGWVRNRRDGSVEALFAGPHKLVAEMVASCHEGPLGARVTHVAENPAAIPELPDFRQLPTE